MTGAAGDGATTAVTATTPTFRFLLRHPAHFLALGFGAGLAPFAPGTFGTLVAIPIAHGLRHVTGDLGYALAVALCSRPARGRPRSRR